MAEPHPPTADDPATEFVRLLAAHEKQLGGYILALVPHWSDAEDIAQETKLRLWKSFHEYDRSKNFGNWAQAIAYYLILAHRKEKQRSAARFSEQFLELVSNRFAAAGAENDARRDALMNCIERLKDADRQLLVECYAGRQSIKDVALRLGRSVRGTQQSVARIRVLLQQCIERFVLREGRP